MSYAQEAARQLGGMMKDLGTPIIYTKVTRTTGPNPTTTTANYSLNAVVSQFHASYVANSLVNQQDRRVLIKTADLPVTPDNGDQVTIGSITYTVFAYDPRYLTGALVAYSLSVKR